MGRKAIDRTGIRYGRLVAISPAGRRGRTGCIAWSCRCDCGRTTIVVGGQLSSGATQSCGCLLRERRLAGLQRRWAGANPRWFIRANAHARPVREVAGALLDWLESQSSPTMLSLTRAGVWRSSRRMAAAIARGSTIVGTYSPGVTLSQLCEDMTAALLTRDNK